MQDFMAEKIVAARSPGYWFKGPKTMAQAPEKNKRNEGLNFKNVKKIL